MMNYGLFKELVTEKILAYMPLKYKSYKVEVHSVTKINLTLDGLNIVPADERNNIITPTIYINDMYDHYIKYNDLEEVLREAAGSIEKEINQLPNTFYKLDFDTAKENIIMQLINTVQNKEILENLPHREVVDLSIIYRWIVDKNSEGISSTMINADLAEKLGMDEEQLFSAAATNTKRLFPPAIRSMNEIVKDIFMKEGMQEEIADMMIGDIADDKVMYVISNDRGINGAVSMLYEDCLHGLAEKLGTDLYILPSSLHEVIAISVTMCDPNELANMVLEVNIDQVSLNERLSNQVYHYDKVLRKLSLATDTPNKRLDGMVSDSNSVFDTKNRFGQNGDNYWDRK